MTRKGAKFHDGTDFNAEAVKFNFDRMMSPQSLAFSRNYLTGSANLASVEIVDDYTVKFVLKTPNASSPPTFRCLDIRPRRAGAEWCVRSAPKVGKSTPGDVAPGTDQ